jgi:hypothetical protein
MDNVGAVLNVLESLLPSYLAYHTAQAMLGVKAAYERA